MSDRERMNDRMKEMKEKERGERVGGMVSKVREKGEWERDGG